MKKTKAGIRELKTNLSEYLRRVERGEVITVTKHGKTIGQIVPVNTNLEKRSEELVKSGVLHWGGKKLSPWKPVAVNKSPGPISDLVSEERDVDHLL